ncbi:DNA modification methylase [uncultured Duncaniella sp.]|uniref:DNA modification methylase n=1 Tax=uncultured Duncaniella sp. TaxID=2768039 RepID=UPI00272A5CC8|nr:DNA modification methylase [uncultured Duncaniella sp.]
MKTEKIKLSQININARNPRKISDKQLERLVRSILIFPEMQTLRPIVIDETYTALGGNMRYRALTAISEKSPAEINMMLANGCKGYAQKTEAERQNLRDYWAAWLADPTAIIVRADQLTEEQKREFIIKDNVAFGEWDDETLTEDFDPDELLDWGLGDLDDEPEDNDADEEDNDADEDDYGEEDAANAPTRCNPGDVWQLGRHRLMCGDSTKEADVAKLMGGERAHLLLTDPPYNVDYQGGTKDKMKIANDNMDDVAFVGFLTAAFNCAIQAMRPGAVFYVWHADSKGYEFRTALKEVGLTLRETLIWVKNALVLGRQDYQWRHEPCLYGWKDGAAHYFVDDRSQSTVIEDAGVDYRKLKKDELLKLVLQLTDVSVPNTVIYEDKPTKNDIHPTMKPVKLMARLIKNSTKQEQLVLDLFGGSGSTLIACEQINRKCFTMEYDPKYCDAILDRWEKLTGEEAERITP